MVIPHFNVVTIKIKKQVELAWEQIYSQNFLSNHFSLSCAPSPPTRMVQVHSLGDLLACLVACLGMPAVKLPPASINTAQQPPSCFV